MKNERYDTKAVFVKFVSVDIHTQEAYQIDEAMLSPANSKAILKGDDLKIKVGGYMGAGFPRFTVETEGFERSMKAMNEDIAVISHGRRMGKTDQIVQSLRKNESAHLKEGMTLEQRNKLHAMADKARDEALKDMREFSAQPDVNSLINPSAKFTPKDADELALMEWADKNYDIRAINRLPNPTAGVLEIVSEYVKMKFAALERPRYMISGDVDIGKIDIKPGMVSTILSPIECAELFKVENSIAGWKNDEETR